MGGGQVPIPDNIRLDMWSIVFQAEDCAPGLRIQDFHKGLSWLLRLHDASSSPIWIIWYEFMWSFQMHTGIRGVAKKSLLEWEASNPIMEYDGVQVCKCFVFCMTRLIRQFYPDFRTEHTKPDNYRWQYWTTCVPFAWSNSDKRVVSTWLSGIVGSHQFQKDSPWLAWLSTCQCNNTSSATSSRFAPIFPCRRKINLASVIDPRSHPAVPAP